MSAAPARRVEAPRRRPAAPRSAPSPRPDLKLVPKPRAAANAAIVLVTLVAVLMLAAVVLHTRLAERQLEIDRLEVAVVDARARFDVLRQQRAELRSPTRLSLASRDLGMHVAARTEFMPVEPLDYAQVLAAVGTVGELTDQVHAAEPLDQIRRVRAAMDGNS